jgi:NTP pyrophosphatase (non-canonical NTP hydrolase)
MDFAEYERLAARTAAYSGKQKEFILAYLALGVAGEAGEVAEKMKKIIRNDEGTISDEKREALKHEIGDVLWYLAMLSKEVGFSFNDAAEANIKKLADRAERGVIKSSGDTR